MLAWNVAFRVLLLTQHSYAADTPSIPSVTPPDSGIDVGLPVDQFVDDIFSQSGVRVFQDAEHESNIYDTFLSTERQKQRAFIWQKLGLAEINFVSREDQLVVQIRNRQVGSNRGEMNNIARSGGLLTRDEVLPRIEGLTSDHVRNVAWNVNMISIFSETLNDKHQVGVGNPVAGATSVERSDVVVNYRTNWRTLVKERLLLLDLVKPDFKGSIPSVGIQRGDFDILTTEILGHRDGSTRQDWLDYVTRLLRQEVNVAGAQRSVAIDVNFEALVDTKDEFIYELISKEIDQKIVGAASSSTDATNVLQEIANVETEAAQRYVKFNCPTCEDTPMLKLRSGDDAHDNIEKVYQLAEVGRKELHYNMKIPFVVSEEESRSNPSKRPYRLDVHFTDPENRYSDIKAVFPESKEWYELTWKRLLEPIFRFTIIPEMQDNIWQGVVLVHADHEQGQIDAAATMSPDGHHMIIDCTFVDLDHAWTRRTIRHEYAHVMDAATDYRLRPKFSTLETLTDMTTWSLSSIREMKERLGPDASPVLDGAENLITLRDMYIYNADNDGGFVTTYAQHNTMENVAEQLSGMLDEAVRISLLRRMSHKDSSLAADRQAQFYDRAREVIKDKAPALYDRWGKYYVDEIGFVLPANQLGLADAETLSPREATHVQIMNLDQTLATDMASDKLATKLLLEGHDVAIFRYTRFGDGQWSPMALLQSNFPDIMNARISTLYIVGNTDIGGPAVARRVTETFGYFTPTGHRRSVTPDSFGPSPFKNIEKIFFVQPPESLVPRNVRFLNDFQKAVSRAVSLDSSMPSISDAGGAGTFNSLNLGNEVIDSSLVGLDRAEPLAELSDPEAFASISDPPDDTVPLPSVSDSADDVRSIPSLPDPENVVDGAERMPSIETHTDAHLWSQDPKLYRNTLFGRWPDNDALMTRTDINEMTKSLMAKVDCVRIGFVVGARWRSRTCSAFAR